MRLRVNFNCFGIGLSGGQRVIFDLANGLSKKGLEANLTVLGSPTNFDWYCGERNFKIKYIYPPAWLRLFKQRILSRNSVYVHQDFLSKHIPDCDVNIATICFSAKPTFESKKGKGFYLVQNFEPWFFDEGVKKTVAEESYGFPLKKLCVSNWLAKKVEGINIGNGVNRDIFRSTVSFENKENKLVYVFRGLSRKNDKMALEAINLFCQRVKDAEVSIIARSGETLPAFSFKHSVHYDVDDKELVKLYGEARASLHTPVFEGFGLQPLESMACGTCAVCTPFYGNEYLDNEVNCLLGGNAEILAAQLEKLFLDEEKCKRIVAEGLKTAAALDFNYVVDRVENILKA
jgi:glycosyltransferase involved in cell wall biosynthesis